MPPGTPKTGRFLRLHAVMDVVGLKSSALNLRIREGTFPKSISIGKGQVRWSEQQILAWQEALGRATRV